VEGEAAACFFVSDVEHDREITMRTIQTLCLLVITAFLCPVLWEASCFIAELRAHTLLLSDDASEVLEGAKDTEMRINDAADEQKQYFKKGSVESLKVIASAKEILIRTDCNLNGGPGCVGTLPQLTATLKSTQILSDRASESLTQTTAALQPVIVDLAVAAKGAAETMNDPSIHATAVEMHVAAQEFAGMATDGHEETGILVAQTKKAVAPQSKLLTVLKFLGGSTVTVAELYYYLSH
jgi:hypothetical protein